MSNEPWNQPVYRGPEPARLLRPGGWAWDNEVRVQLPISYEETDGLLPTVWVLDNGLEPMRQALSRTGPPTIIVSVGGERTISTVEFQIRRSFEFSPSDDEIGALGRDAFPPGTPVPRMGGAGRYLDWIVDELRSMLSEEFRMDPNLHALVGHSGGGSFGLYTLFKRPDAFSRILCSSPAKGANWLAMEEHIHETSGDLPVKLFMSAGTEELIGLASAGIVSTVATIAERLATRGYESLELRAQLIADEDHMSVCVPAYARGVGWLYNDIEVPPPDPVAMAAAMAEALAQRGQRADVAP